MIIGVNKGQGYMSCRCCIVDRLARDPVSSWNYNQMSKEIPTLLSSISRIPKKPSYQRTITSSKKPRKSRKSNYKTSRTYIQTLRSSNL